jgi:ferric-dicitrate binding protein FerR (iron transport regulator)
MLTVRRSDKEKVPVTHEKLENWDEAKQQHRRTYSNLRVAPRPFSSEDTAIAPKMLRAKTPAGP